MTNYFERQNCIEDSLIIDELKIGDDPTYELEHPSDIVYIGLDGVVASEIKCSKITLPMISKDPSGAKYLIPETRHYFPKLTIRKTLSRIIASKPKIHVDSFKEAYLLFSRKSDMYDYVKPCNKWFGNKEVISSLKNQIVTYDLFDYNTNLIHDIIIQDNCELDLDEKIIAFVPDDFGVFVKAIDTNCYNFLLLSNRIFVYYLNKLKIE